MARGKYLRQLNAAEMALYNIIQLDSDLAKEMHIKIRLGSNVQSVNIITVRPFLEGCGCHFLTCTDEKNHIVAVNILVRSPFCKRIYPLTPRIIEVIE